MGLPVSFGVVPVRTENIHTREVSYSKMFHTHKKNHTHTYTLIHIQNTHTHTKHTDTHIHLQTHNEDTLSSIYEYSFS